MASPAQGDWPVSTVTAPAAAPKAMMPSEPRFRIPTRSHRIRPVAASRSGVM